MTIPKEPLLLSGLQHFAFCRRQWVLIHIEQQWQENVRTVEGQLMHRNAHRANFFEMRDGILIARGLRIRSERLNVTGSCDVVEFHPDPAGSLFYGETRRRHLVVFTEELRRQIESLLAEMQSYMEHGYTPRVKPTKGCNACSLVSVEVRDHHAGAYHL